jgi:glycosyltransferase involved in cell wall biosynthesis
MKILFFTPYYKQNRGNATTAKRIVHGLRLMNIEVFVFAYEEESWSYQWQQILLEVDLYHILHLRRFASWQKQQEISLEKPYVLTSGGTDINEDLADAHARELMGNVADDSCSVTVFTEDGKRKIEDSYPELAERTHVIPQSIWLPDAKQTTNELPKGDPVIVLPAGLRAVKDIFYLWEAFKELAADYLELKVVFVGAALDDSLLTEVIERQKNNSWFSYIGEVSLEEMHHIYEQADIVINSSLSEGQPTALLEAMHAGRLVIARDIPGNRSVVIDQENGFLFQSNQQFKAIVCELMSDPPKASKVADQGRRYVAKHHQLTTEISAYVDVYRHCIRKASN